jgi:hypothetical protein
MRIRSSPYLSEGLSIRVQDVIVNHHVYHINTNGTSGWLVSGSSRFTVAKYVSGNH